MTAPNWMSGPPKSILLATDLSPRCDRALDRAAALAAQWQSALLVLHVLEAFEPGSLETVQLPSWRRPPDPVSLARKQLLADVGAVADRATVLIGEGAAVETILHTAEEEQCELIVIGIARDELLGRFRLGRTVDRLLRRSRVPLLVVKDRPRAEYRNIVVATDFSDSSRHAVEAAARYFPSRTLTLFHAYEAPMSRPTPDVASYRRDYRKDAARDCEAFLEKVDKPATWQTAHVAIEDGQPTFLLRNYVREKDVDLVVLGTHGRSALLEIFLGSVAKAIMDEVPCDALVIREPRAAVETQASEA
jgi:nucleotide-binding universal stress UspA family protein